MFTKRLRSLFATLTLASSVTRAPGAAEAAPSAPADIPTRIEEAGNGYIAARPGCALVIGVLRDGKRTVRGFGSVSAANQRTPDGNTVFEIGSITKAFTGLLLAVLCRDKVVKVDEAIDELLPAGVKPPPRLGRAITLRDLATHTSGLPRLPGNLVFNDVANPYANYTNADLFAGLAGAKMSGKLGAASVYSNLGFALLGQLLAEAAGKPYKEMVEERICEPLGLADTRFELTGAQSERLAEGHGPDGAVARLWDQDAIAPAGGLKSTANDLLSFAEAAMSGLAGKLGPEFALTRSQAYEVATGRSVGLGWQIDAGGPDGQEIVWHNGGTGGYVCFAGFDPEKRVAAVILSSYGDALTGKTPTDGMGMELLRKMVETGGE